MTENERFRELCRLYSSEDALNTEKGIGTYSEKRLHRILKNFAAEPEYHEIPVGKYIADVMKDGHITEIQTKDFSYSLPKLRYYLDNTDCTVTLVLPIISEKTVIRIDKETGEVLRKRRSPARKSFFDGIETLYHIREILLNDRIEIRFLLISAEEHRYSERMRYRKTGAYISELFPMELIDEKIIVGAEDLKEFLPSESETFTAKEYGAFSRKKGRGLYSCLNFLCAAGVLERRKEGKRYVYVKK